MDYVAEKEIDPEIWGKYEDMGAGATTLGAVESALMSSGTMRSVLHAQIRRKKERAAARATEKSEK